MISTGSLEALSFSSQQFYVEVKTKSIRNYNEKALLKPAAQLVTLPFFHCNPVLYFVAPEGNLNPEFNKCTSYKLE